MKRRFNIAQWSRKHPRAAARARAKARAARRSTGTRAIALARQGPRAILRKILLVITDHERRIRALEGRP